MFVGSAIGAAVGSAVGSAVGVAAVGVELETGEDATEAGVLSDFLHPLGATRTRRRHKIPAFGSQPARLPKSKKMFTDTVMDCIKDTRLQPQVNVVRIDDNPDLDYIFHKPIFTEQPDKNRLEQRLKIKPIMGCDGQL